LDFNKIPIQEITIAVYLQMVKINYKTILFLILILSLFLNSWGIKWGLPSKERIALLPKFEDVSALLQEKEVLTDKNTSLVGLISNYETLPKITRRFLLYTHHPDEMLTIMAITRMNPSKLDFNPHFFQYGGVFIYPIAASFKIGSILGYLDVSKGLDYFLDHPDQIARFYIVGRWIVVFSCLLSILAIYFVVSAIGNKTSALLAALILTILPSTVIWAHTFKPHMYGVFFALISFYFAFKILKERQLSHYIWSGIFAGLSAGAVINYGIIIFPSLLAALLYSIQHKERIYIKGLLFLGIGFIFAFFIPNYYYLFSFKEALNEFRVLSGMWEFSPTPAVWFDYLIIMKEVIGASLFFLMMGGFIYSLYKSIWHRDKIHILLSTTACLYFFLIGSLTSLNTADIGRIRFGLLLISILVIMTALFIVSFLNRIRHRHLKVVFTAILLGIFLLTLSKTILYDLNFFYDSTSRSTRMLAGKWINKNIPEGSSIQLWHSPAPFNSPPLKFDNYQIIVEPLKNVEYIISSYQPEWDNNQNDYILLKSFEPITSILGFKLINPFYFSNHLVSIFIRKDLYPEMIRILED